MKYTTTMNYTENFRCNKQADTWLVMMAMVLMKLLKRISRNFIQNKIFRYVMVRPYFVHRPK